MSKLILRYVTTRADQIAKLQLYARSSSAARWFPPMTYVTIIMLSWLSTYLFYVRQGDRNLLYLAAGGLAAFLTIALPWLYRRYQDSFFNSVLTDDNLRGLIGPVELTLDDDLIEERGKFSSVRSRWVDVLAIEDGASYIAIRVAPMVAIIVPHRAFETDQSRLEFAALAQARLASHRA